MAAAPGRAARGRGGGGGARRLGGPGGLAGAPYPSPGAAAWMRQTQTDAARATSAERLRTAAQRGRQAGGAAAAAAAAASVPLEHAPLVAAVARGGKTFTIAGRAVPRFDIDPFDRPDILKLLQQSGMDDEREFVAQLGELVVRTCERFAPDSRAATENGLWSKAIYMDQYLHALENAPLRLPSFAQLGLAKRLALFYDMSNGAGMSIYSLINDSARLLRGSEMVVPRDGQHMDIEGRNHPFDNFVVIGQLPAQRPAGTFVDLRLPGWYFGQRTNDAVRTCMVVRRVGGLYATPYFVGGDRDYSDELETIMQSALAFAAAADLPSATVLCVVMSGGHAAALTYTAMLGGGDAARERYMTVFDPIGDGFEEVTEHDVELVFGPEGLPPHIWLRYVTRPGAALEAAAEATLSAKQAAIVKAQSGLAAGLTKKQRLEHLVAAAEPASAPAAAAAAERALALDLRVTVRRFGLGLQGSGLFARIALGDRGGDLFMCGAWAQFIAAALLRSAWTYAWPTPIAAGARLTFDQFMHIMVLGDENWNAFAAHSEVDRVAQTRWAYLRAVKAVKLLYASGVSRGATTAVNLLQQQVAASAAAAAAAAVEAAAPVPEEADTVPTTTPSAATAAAVVRASSASPPPPMAAAAAVPDTAAAAAVVPSASTSAEPAPAEDALDTQLVAALSLDLSGAPIDDAAAPPQRYATDGPPVDVFALFDDA